MAENTEPAARGVACSRLLERPGYNALWEWFGLSRASWATLPRVLMHEMPDEWQAKMAALLAELDATWNSEEMPTPYVGAKDGRHFTKWPEWLLNYRRPDQAEIARLRSNNQRQVRP